MQLCTKLGGVRSAHSMKHASSMTSKEKRRLIEVIGDKGFNGTFEDYSDFEDISDPKFHQLRLAYLQAMTALRAYIRSGEEDYLF